MMEIIIVTDNMVNYVNNYVNNVNNYVYDGNSYVNDANNFFLSNDVKKQIGLS